MKKRKVTAKGRALGTIRRHSEAAAFLRKRGLIQFAQRIEKNVDRMVSKAERKGFGDAAFAAEEAGQRKAK